MTPEQYEKLIASAENIRSKAAEFHKVASDTLSTAQKALDNFTAAFLDGVEKGVADATAKYESAESVWHSTTDSPRSTPKSGVEDQIADAINRIRDSYMKTNRGKADENPFKTVQDLANEIFNPKPEKPKDNDGTV
jgi:hypothetical protein